ncbi:MAG: hypothetical protein KDK03_10310 [Rhodobacteraceae bacterium]|nr:hypothetical protein [Paracoccaceae bacterium]
MTDLSGMKDRWLQGIATLAIVVALALRLFGPGGALPVREGYVTLCTGSEILYIPLSELGLAPPDDTPTAPVSDHCPWFFQFHPLPVTPFVFELLAGIFTVQPRPPLPPVAAAGRVAAAFHARGPPTTGA